MIVVHERLDELFRDRDTQKKTLDRFEHPVRIELPDNIAFQLMHRAMKVTSDPALAQEWQDEDRPTLNQQLTEARSVILRETRNKASLGDKTLLKDEELQGIVPMHPYAALVLKHMATLFNSNQRSMFDFIISNDMQEAKGFKWYISEYGPLDRQNLLTVDLLWDFFYAQNGLTDAARSTLDHFRLSHPEKLVPDQQRVLKTVLLLQAVHSFSYTAYGASGDQKGDILLPNDQNLDLAFLGTDWQKGKAVSIAAGLVEQALLFRRPLGGGKFEYNATVGRASDSMEPYKKKIRESEKTQALIERGNLLEAVRIPDALRMRYIAESASNAQFPSVVRKLRGDTRLERYSTLVTFALDDTEAQLIRGQIQKLMRDPAPDMVIIETLSPMGGDLWEQYVDAMAHSAYHVSSDKQQAVYYQNRAEDVLRQWKSRVENGAFCFYTFQHPGGERKADLADLQLALADWNQQRYYSGLDQYTLNAALYAATQTASGAECGIRQEVKNLFKSGNSRTSVESALSGAWKVERYWEEPSKQGLAIVRIKKRVMEVVEAGFQTQAGEISMEAIWAALEQAPYGFMPSNLSALVLGFVLKEYVSEAYFWSDGNRTEPMTVEKMKLMIANVIKQRLSPARNYREEFIRTMSPEIRAFLDCTANAFRIPATQCGSVDSARDQIRAKLRTFAFPLWCVKFTLNQEPLQSPAERVSAALDCYTGVANTDNLGGKDTESILAEKIGTMLLETPSLREDLARVINSDHSRQGMQTYIADYQEGILPRLAAEIGDGGAYMEAVRQKFSAKEANWLWDTATADRDAIDSVILDYQIILESNKSVETCRTLRDTVSAWNTRTNYIRIPGEVAAKHTGELGPFLGMLLQMKRAGVLQEQDKQKFYDLLVAQQEHFREFYQDQIPCFVQAAKSFLGDLDDGERAELYGEFAPGQFTKSPSEYYQYVEAQVRQYVNKQLRKRLQTLWREKTGTNTPTEWSRKFLTPLLCMFDEEERMTAREIFRIVESVSPTKEDAERAGRYLTETMEESGAYERMNSAEARDVCFMKRVVRDGRILLKDPERIREHLSRCGEQPQNWLESSTVRSAIHALLDREYKLSGYERVREQIDRMDAESLRKYLLRRIDDVDFGMQILKGE